MSRYCLTPSTQNENPLSRLLASSILTFKSEADTNLVGGLVELLGIERSTKAQGDAGAEEDIVGNGSNTTVVDLGLS